MKKSWQTFGITAAMVLFAGTALAQSSTVQGAGGVGSSGTDQQPKESTQADPDAKRAKDQMTRDTMMGDKKHSVYGRHAKMGHTEARATQEALKSKGFDPGPIDGVMGPRTGQALRDFQKQEGLTETGRLDGDTRAKLGV